MDMPGREEIADAMGALGYEVYDRKPRLGFFLNIVGLRSGRGGFSDALCVFYRTETGWAEHRFRIATEPSQYYIDNPGTRKGTSRMMPGQYRLAYKFGIHRAGKPRAHLALCQHSGAVAVERFDPATGLYAGREAARIGLNIHAIPEQVEEILAEESWSAGCQVFAPGEDFALFLSLCALGRFARRGRFTYTLLDMWAAPGRSRSQSSAPRRTAS